MVRHGFACFAILCFSLLCLSSLSYSDIWEIDWSNPVPVADGVMPEVKLDSQDNLVMAYVDRGVSQDALMLARLDGSAWSFENVATANRFHSIDLELTTFDTPYVAYLFGATDCEIAKRIEQGSWDTEYVGEVASDIDLALDRQNRPHILAANLSNLGLQYLYLDKMQWHTEIIDSAIAPGYGVSMVLESDDVAHIAYCKKGSESLKYGVRNEIGNWKTETVQSVTSAWYSCPTIDLAADTTPHLSYCYSFVDDETPVLGSGGGLYYTNRSNGTWAAPSLLYSEFADFPMSSGLGLNPVTLLVDRWNRMWVPTIGCVNFQVYSIWQTKSFDLTEEMDSSDDAYCSSVVDSRGNPHVLFAVNDGTTSRIYYVKGELKQVPHSTDYYPDGVVDENDLFLLMNSWMKQ